MAQSAPSPGNSVTRILHHVDRLMTFHTVEWFLQERDKEAILKMNFTQDRGYNGTFPQETANSLPRVRDHMDRLAKSHRLREWDLHETDGRATIVVAFQFEDVKSQEDHFFMTSSHLQFADEPSGKNCTKTPKDDCSNSSWCSSECEIPASNSNAHGLHRTAEGELSELSLPYLTPIKTTHLPSGNTHTQSHKKQATTTKTEHAYNDKRSVTTVPRTSDIREKTRKTAIASNASRTNMDEVTAESSNGKMTVKGKTDSSNPVKAGKGLPSAHNPFSVNAATRTTTSMRNKPRYIKQPSNSKLGTLQRSKSTSSIKLTSDPTRGKHSTTASQIKQSSSQNKQSALPKTGFSSSRFTFRKAYSKSKEEDKNRRETNNVSVKRKTADVDETEDRSNESRIETPTVNGIVKSTHTLQKQRHKSDSVAVATGVTSQSSTMDNTESLGDLYRLCFADSADASLCNVSCLRQDQTPGNSSHVRQYNSTPANTQDKEGMTFGAFGDLFRHYFPDSSENAKCNLTDIPEPTTPESGKDKKNVPDTRPESITSGVGESHSSDTESSVEDNPQETTLTEASRTSESSEAFSCCTEPCLEEGAKVEIQDYYLKIYNQIHRDLRVETDQLVWYIDESGRICLHHKGLKQTKVHNLVTPEELLDVDQDRSSHLIPGTVKQQYVFRRLLEELDQVTFDNRALSSDEKKRLDRLMNKTFA